MRRLRIRLNAGFSGPHAGFLLAEEMGLLAQAGITAEWQPGNGAAAVIADMAEDVCDLAYGDLSALVMRLGHSAPGSGPQAVFIGFNRTPLTIAVPVAGGAQHPTDLAGRLLTGHARDAALVAEVLLQFNAAGTAPRSRAALNPALELASRWCADQGLMARPLSLDEIWAGLPAAVV